MRVRTISKGLSVLAKAVSPISIQTSSMPVDQYGKRVYVPTRVDFPEVSLTMYDTVDGKMFDVCANIYSKFFKNNHARSHWMNAEEVLTSWPCMVERYQIANMNIIINILKRLQYIISLVILNHCCKTWH